MIAEGTKQGDVVAVLLGLRLTLILRPVAGQFQVVGPANIHGLNDAQAVLGPIPEPWTVRIERPGDIWRFYNTATGELSAQDPRLGPLDEGWARLKDGKFLERGTGRVSHLDPRCSPEKLSRLGADLVTLALI